jgi:hypothetical protein
MTKKWKRSIQKENKMSICVLYIMLSGGVFMTPACHLDSGVVYPDKIIYTDTIPDSYSYVPYQPPIYAPTVVYRDWRPLPNRYDRVWRPRRANRRNITINRYYYQNNRTVVRKPVNKVKVVKPIASNKKKKKFNKKKN